MFYKPSLIFGRFCYVTNRFLRLLQADAAERAREGVVPAPRMLPPGDIIFLRRTSGTAAMHSVRAFFSRLKPGAHGKSVCWCRRAVS